MNCTESALPGIVSVQLGWYCTSHTCKGTLAHMDTRVCVRRKMYLSVLMWMRYQPAQSTVMGPQTLKYTVKIVLDKCMMVCINLQTAWVHKVHPGKTNKIFLVHLQKAPRLPCLDIKSRPVYSAPPTTCLSSQLQSVIHLLPAPFTDTWVGAGT